VQVRVHGGIAIIYTLYALWYECVSYAFRRTHFLVYVSRAHNIYTLGPSSCKELRHVPWRLCGVRRGFQSATHSDGVVITIIIHYIIYTRYTILYSSDSGSVYRYYILIYIYILCIYNDTQNVHSVSWPSQVPHVNNIHVCLNAS